MEPQRKTLFSSRVSILGLFSTLIIVLATPLLLLLSQQTQNLQSNAYKAPVVAKPLPVLQATGYISGYVYIDQNQNGNRDQGESAMPQVTIKITRVSGKNTVTDLQTDTNGYFIYKFPSPASNNATYLVKIIVPAGYKTIGTNPVTYSNLYKNEKRLVQFGLVESPSESPSLSLTPSCIPRPACLDAIPRCLLPEPIGGWCPDISTMPSVSPTPAPTHSWNIQGN